VNTVQTSHKNCEWCNYEYPAISRINEALSGNPQMQKEFDKLVGHFMMKVNDCFMQAHEGEKS
jgi:hypothetical protein